MVVGYLVGVALAFGEGDIGEADGVEIVIGEGDEAEAEAAELDDFIQDDVGEQLADAVVDWLQ